MNVSRAETKGSSGDFVSIVVTAYNDQETVVEALESALAQDWSHREIIVVLDGPEDATPARVAPFADRGVRVISKENGGTASARNAGLAAAKGAWIQFLDADDVLLADKISASFEALARAAEPDRIALVYTGYYRIDAGGHVIAEHRAKPYSRHHLLTVPGHVTTNPLIRVKPLRDVGGYNGDYVYAEDTEVYHRLALRHAMLAVPTPHFLYRVSATQKTQVMRRHPRGDLIVAEPARIRQTFTPLFERHVPDWMHPPGALSRRGVLDVGLRCPHSCKFCYYSFMDGGDDQFAAMRRAPWRPDAESRSILAGFAEAGLTHFDLTGGEPALYPRLVELVRYAREDLGLRARLITLGQFLTRRTPKRAPLLDRLIDAGLDDLLLSVHAVDPELFKAATGGDFYKLEEVMNDLDARDFSYGTNTLIYQENYRHLPDVAAYLVDRRVRIVNLIVMNTYFQWNRDGRVLGVQARYRDIHPYLAHAVARLEEAGKAVNIRYGPLCAYRGMEKNFVGVLGVELDPYEWRSTLRTGQVKHYRDVLHYLQVQRASLDNPGSMFTKTFGHPCEACALRPICDGVDSKYIAEYGWSEFEPYPLAVGDAPEHHPLRFRLSNPLAFQLKSNTAGDEEMTEIERLEEELKAQPTATATRMALAKAYLRHGDLVALEGLLGDLEALPDVSLAEVLFFRSLRPTGVGAALPQISPVLEVNLKTPTVSTISV